MRWLVDVRWRLFLVCWIVFSVHFATNVVREHYPAFSLVEDGDLFLDEYAGFHADIYLGPRGHHVVGNQIAGSLPAVPPLLLFDPALDALQAYSLSRLDEGEGGDAEYATDRPNRAAFFRKVREQGLELRFGAATAITSVFCMAPLTAGAVVFFFAVLRRRGVREPRAVAIALLFAVGTPLFYRSAHLVHNMFFMMAIFGCFWLLWAKPEEEEPLPPGRIAWAGFLAGLGLALDYAGAVTLLAFYGYLLFPRWKAVGFKQAFVESLPFVLGSVPPVLFLWWTQWVMYGNPFLPGQTYQQENAYTAAGWRGMTLPSLEVLWRNLFDPSWGLYAFGPILLLGLVPVRLLRIPQSEWILPLRERRFLVVFLVVFMLFCAINRFSLLQWNTGFRYFLPLVPLILLQASDLLTRLPRGWLVAIAVPAVAHSWVLAMSRFTQPHGAYDGPPVVLENWREILTEGPKLPWLTVLRQVVPDPEHWIHSPLWPTLVLALSLGVCAAIWFGGARIARSQQGSEGAGA